MKSDVTFNTTNIKKTLDFRITCFACVYVSAIIYQSKKMLLMSFVLYVGLQICTFNMHPKVTVPCNTFVEDEMQIVSTDFTVSRFNQDS